MPGRISGEYFSAKISTVFGLTLKGLCRLFLSGLLISLAVVLLLIFVFPVFFGDRAAEYNYYAYTAVTLITLIPFFCGLRFFMVVYRQGSLLEGGDNEHSVREGWRTFIRRALICSVSVYPLLLVTIFLTDAVISEGWLRTVYISGLLALMVPFTWRIISVLASSTGSNIAAFLLASLFIVAVPSGLLLLHPWNYIVFFSPYYWISWSWIITSPLESLAYGMIAIAIASGMVIFSFRYGGNS